MDLVGVDYFGHATDASIVPASTSIDVVLMEVKRLTQLEEVHVHGSSVSNAGLAHLKGLGHLTTLCLRETRVTDAGLVHLKGLTKLAELDLSGTRVTDAGVNELKQELPGLSIKR